MLNQSILKSDKMSRIIEILFLPIFALAVIFAIIGKSLWLIHPFLDDDDYSEFCDKFL